MRAHLAAKDILDPTASTVVAELEEQGYLDDARYAELFAEDRRNLDDWGPGRIRRRLSALGVDRDLIEAAVGVRDRDDELAAALDLLARRFPDPPRDPRTHNRALAMLARKGFGVELAGDALRAHARSSTTG